MHSLPGYVFVMLCQVFSNKAVAILKSIYSVNLLVSSLCKGLEVRLQKFFLGSTLDKFSLLEKSIEIFERKQGRVFLYYFQHVLQSNGGKRTFNVTSVHSVLRIS